MVCKDSICNFIVNAKMCSADLAAKYVAKANYGYPDAKNKLKDLTLLRCYIKVIENYNVVTSDDVIENGVMTLNGKVIVLSKNNSLSLESDGKKIQVDPDNVNCLSEEDICSIVEKIRAFCSNC